MKFEELENGMTVKLEDGRRGIVYKGFMTYDYIVDIDTGKLLYSRSNKY